MNLLKFDEVYGSLKGSEQINVDDLCDHPKHIKADKTIGKTNARRNILKSGGESFICRKCMMTHNNPFNRGPNYVSRQTTEIINVYCPLCDTFREMEMRCYYGKMEKPYIQTCGSCGQEDKIVSEETKAKISESLAGRVVSEETKQKISETWKNSPDLIERAKLNLIAGSGAGWNKGKQTPADVREKISKANKGKKRTDEIKKKISSSRKAMLKTNGGFSQEHRENISKAVVKQYAIGFEPKLYHIKGRHYTPKSTVPLFFRSSYEKRAFELLDADLNVKSYKSETVTVQYWHPVRKINANYIVDIEATLTDNSILHIEVKPLKLINHPIIKAKLDTARQKLTSANSTFQVWTEEQLFGSNEAYARQYAITLRESLERQKKIT